MTMLKPRIKNRQGFLKFFRFSVLEKNNNAPMTIAPIKNLAAVIAPGSISFATRAPKM